MKTGELCYHCLLERHRERAEKEFPDAETRELYLEKVRDILDRREEEDSPPYLGIAINRVFRELGGQEVSYRELKKEYNAFVLGMEKELEEVIREAEDPLQQAFLFARVGNYIDFGAVKDVSKEKFIELLREAGKDGIPEKIWKEFLSDLSKAKTFLLLHDNCGEIVLDKLLLRELKKRYPGITWYSMVRGGEASNDAAMEDARDSGLTEEVQVITNGVPVPSTIYKLLPDREREIFDRADVILSKGQANYESLRGMDRNIYYSFLCKCRFFLETFQAEPFTGMFIK